MFLIFFSFFCFFVFLGKCAYLEDNNIFLQCKTASSCCKTLDSAFSCLCLWGSPPTSSNTLPPDKRDHPEIIGDFLASGKIDRKCLKIYFGNNITCNVHFCRLLCSTYHSAPLPKEYLLGVRWWRWRGSGGGGRGGAVEGPR